MRTAHIDKFSGQCPVEPDLSPVSIHAQSLAFVNENRKNEETQALALARSQSWLPLLRPSIPIGWRLRLLREKLK